MRPIAPYAKVKLFLRDELSRGRWSPGDLMPSEAELTARFGVSRMTVNRALRELQSEGLVDRLQGVGTFAAYLNRVSASLTIRDIHEEIDERGHQHVAIVHSKRAEKVDESLSARFGLPVGSAVFHSEIVHLENDVALQYEDRYVNPACAPDYLDVDFSRVTPTRYLLEVAPLWEAKFSVHAHCASAREAKLLKLKSGEACLVVDRMTMNRGVPITIARLVHPGSRYQIEGRFKP